MTVKAGEEGPRRNILSAKESKYQNVCPIIEGDITGSFIDKDVHYERTRGMEVMTVKARGEGPRRNILSTKQSKYQNVCPIIEGDITGSFVDKDVHYERT